jgi:hypothetical protein
MRAARLLSAAALAAAVVSIPMFVSAPSTVSHVAVCPNGMVPNPGGYGCVPVAPRVGAPSQEVLTRCHGNYWICIWPYGVP